jgi:putative transposase
MPIIFGKVLEAINRRQFQTIVDRHDGDAYDKSFKSWDHLVALIFAQFSATDSLRGLEIGWNANSQHHYHLASGPLARSTLSDANKRRAVAVFAQTFGMVAAQLDRTTRRDGRAMLRLIDSTPIPLGKLCGWAKSNGRIRGMKMHVVYDPKADYPRILDITDANVNDAQIGRRIAIEPGASYVFDKGYCHYGWWQGLVAGAGGRGWWQGLVAGAGGRRSRPRRPISSPGPKPIWASSWSASAPLPRRTATASPFSTTAR